MVAIEIIEESPLQISIVIKKEKIEELGNCCNKIKFIFNLALEGSNRTTDKSKDRLLEKTEVV